MADRNELCHCGSGQKYKKCCALNDAKKAQFPVGLIVLIAVIALVIVVGFAPSAIQKIAGEKTPTPVAAAAAASTMPVAIPGSPQPAGQAPAGKVWSVEHGHWHDAVPAANSAIQIQAEDLPSGLVATPGTRPDRGTPPEPDATWSEEHGHWHKAGTNIAVGAPTAAAPAPARGTPPEPGATWSEEHGHWHKAGTNIAVGPAPSGATAVNPATGAPIGADPAPQSPTQVRAFGELVDLTAKPGTPQPGPAPEGQEWSTEHGHWHQKPQP